VAGVVLEGLVELGQGVGAAPQVEQGGAEVDAHVVVGGLEGERLAVPAGRLLVLRVVHVQVAQLDPHLHVLLVARGQVLQRAHLVRVGRSHRMVVPVVGNPAAGGGGGIGSGPRGRVRHRPRM
jgi:hypothetical protein